MKKMYSKPQMELVEMATAYMLANSDSIKGLDGTSYGGVDEDGTKDPASRQYNGWNDDEAF